MSKLLDGLRSCGRSYARIKTDLKLLSAFAIEVAKSHPSWGPGTTRAYQEECEFSSSWAANGEIVYRLSHSLSALFAMTSAPRIDWDHMPHSAFIIQVPRKFLPMEATLQPAAEETSIYVSERQAILVPDYDTTGRVMVYGHDNSFSFENLLTDNRQMADKVRTTANDPKSLEEYTNQLKGVLDKTEFGSQIPKELHGDFAKAVALVEFARYREAAEQMEKFRPDELGIAVLGNRFTSNVMAYLSEVTKTGNVVKRPTPASAGTLIDLLPPQHVVVNRTMRDAAQDVVDAVMAGSLVGIRRVMKHYVRGHWKNQAHGENRSLRKQKWIFPYERGNEDLGVVVRRIETLDVPGQCKTN